MTDSPIRAVFLTNVVSPLHVPLLARIHARGAIDLRVLYLNENEETRRWREDPATMTFPYEILWEERQVRSVANLTRTDGEELLPLAAEAGVRAQVTTYPLAEANRALAELRSGELEGSAVLLVGAD